MHPPISSDCELRAPDGSCRNLTARLAVDSYRFGEASTSVIGANVQNVTLLRFSDEVDDT